jgi:small-conductance mechanosensitive channel
MSVNNPSNNTAENSSSSNQSMSAPQDLGEVAESIQDTLLSIWSDFIDHIPYLVGGLLILLLTWVVTTLIERTGRRLMRRSRLRRSLKDLIVRLIMIAVWVFGLLLAAMVVFPGLTPANALGGLGIASIAVGLAFKDIFENFFAGILLLWRFPFENGDFIECEGILGEIEEVSIRMTKIRKTTGELVVVPNSFLFKNPVDVLTNQNHRRVTIITGVAYDANVAEAVEVIEKVVNSGKTVSKGKPIQVFPKAFGSSSIDIEVTWWTGPRPVDIRRSRGEIITLVKRALDEAGIEIPYPYRTLTFKEPLVIDQKVTQNKQ